MRRATFCPVNVTQIFDNFYPRSPCGERPLPNISFITSILLISIHALLAESDGHRSNDNSYDTYFYPRSPCGERRKPCRTKHSTNPFLSTLSLRRATIRHRIHHQLPNHFYPRSPCGERQNPKNEKARTSRFLSTLSLRRATPAAASSQPSRPISIHALLAESDYNQQHNAM